MQVVDRVACSGYSYISPTVDRACNAVPVLGGIKQRIQPYAPPLIQKADLCVDIVYGVAEVPATAIYGVAKAARDKAFVLKDAAYCAVDERATVLRQAVTSTGGKAQNLIGESVVVARVHKTALAMVDTFDMLVDRYLPEPEFRNGTDESTYRTQQYLIPRILHIPFTIPVRMVRISIAKAHNGCDVIQVRIRLASQLTWDQKAKLQALILSKSQAAANSISSSSLAITLQQRKQSTFKFLQGALQSLDNGKSAVAVKCYVVLEKCHVIEFKDWSLRNVSALQHVAVDRTSQMFAVASQHAYDVTSRVVGQDRATRISTLVSKRLPFVKVAVRASAPTNALSETARVPAPTKAFSEAEFDHAAE